MLIAIGIFIGLGLIVQIPTVEARIIGLFNKRPDAPCLEDAIGKSQDEVNRLIQIQALSNGFQEQVKTLKDQIKNYQDNINKMAEENTKLHEKLDYANNLTLEPAKPSEVIKWKTTDGEEFESAAFNHLKDIVSTYLYYNYADRGTPVHEQAVALKIHLAEKFLINGPVDTPPAKTVEAAKTEPRIVG